PLEVWVEAHHELLTEHATDFAEQRVLLATPRPGKGALAIGDEVHERGWTLEVGVRFPSSPDLTAHAVLTQVAHQVQRAADVADAAQVADLDAETRQVVTEELARRRLHHVDLGRALGEDDATAR